MTANQLHLDDNLHVLGEHIADESVDFDAPAAAERKSHYRPGT